MFERIESDYYIKIGIKDNKVIEVDWRGMILKGIGNYKDYKKEIKNKLKKAIKFIDKK
jgi:hypothetical protein